MIITVTILKFIFGLLFLIKGADYLIQGSIALANRLRIDKFIIGVVVISFGTSFPELVIGVLASLKETDAGSLVLGNVIGSNISNVLFILGVSAIATPILLEKKILLKEVLLNLFLAIFLLAIVGLNFSEKLILPRWSGIILLLIFVIYNVYLFVQKEDLAVEEQAEIISFFKIFFLLTIGIIGLYLGGDWLINSSIYLAEEILNVNKGLVGLTLIAFGTSLPELVSCLIAARKKEVSLILGGILGSNIFNVMIVLSSAIVIKPLVFAQEYFYDLLINAGIIFILIIAYFLPPKHILKFHKGIVFLSLYITYLVYTILTKGGVG